MSPSGGTTAAETGPEGAAGGKDAAPSRIGAYRIERELGRGAQGAVFLAFDERLGRRVALKTMSVLRTASAAAMSRFEREARILASLDHPGICPVYESGTEAGVPYLAMRYVEGETWAARLARRTTSPDGAGIALEIVLVEKIARAAHAAHEAGVVHRDLKPANVMIDAEGEPIILDFGMAADASAATAETTLTGELVGTPHYMSPEQASGDVRAVDRRSDVHALGAMLFEAVVGARPYAGEHRAALLDAVRTAAPPDARAGNPRVSGDLSTVLQTALAKAAADRYPTALAMADDLRRVRSFEPIAARPIPWTGRVVRFARRRPAVASLVLTLLVAVPALGAAVGSYLADRPLILAQKAAAADQQYEQLLEWGYAGLFFGDHDRASDRFEKAATMRPDSIEALFGRIESLLRRRDIDGASRLLTAFASAYGENSSLERMRADVLRRKGDLAGAAALEATLPPPDGPTEWFTAAMRELRAARSGVRGAAERAVFGFETAMQRTPIRRRLYALGYCEAAGLGGDEAQARRAAATIRVVLTGPEAELAAGRALMAFDPEAAVEAFERASARSPAVDFEQGVMHALQSKGDVAGAARVARSLVKRRPDDATAFYNLSLIEDQLQNAEASFEAARKAFELRPDLPLMQGLYGERLTSAGRVDEACVVLRKAAAASPDDALVRIHLATALNLAGDDEAAMAEIASARKLAPQSIEVRWIEIRILAAEGATEALVERIGEAVDLSGETITNILGNAEHLVRHRGPASGLRMLDSLVAAVGEDGLSALQRGQIQMLQSQFAAAPEPADAPKPAPHRLR